MGDLDTFFAKKDKKKKGSKGYSKANTDIIAKNLEESERKEIDKQEKQEYNGEMVNNNDNNNTNNKEDEDEEWAEYREKVKDYSVLKIESVRLVDSIEGEDLEEKEEKEDGDQENDEKEESEEEGDGKEKGDAEKEEALSETEEEKENQNRELPNVVGPKKSSYVPPHMRGVQAQGSSPAQREQTRPMHPRRMKLAPDIKSEVYFPSLGEGGPDSGPKGAWGKKLEM